MMLGRMQLTCSHKILEKHFSSLSTHPIKGEGGFVSFATENSKRLGLKADSKGERRSDGEAQLSLHGRIDTPPQALGFSKKRDGLTGSSSDLPTWRCGGRCSHGRKRRGCAILIREQEVSSEAFMSSRGSGSRRGRCLERVNLDCGVVSDPVWEPERQLRWRKLSGIVHLGQNSSIARRCRRSSSVPHALSSDAGNEPAIASESTSGREQGKGTGETAAAYQRGKTNWKEQMGTVRKPQSVGERIMDALVNSTSSPIGSYVSKPITILHQLDPRVKQAWLLALVVIPARAPLAARSALIALVVFLSVSCLPRRLWKDQLGRLAILCTFVFVGMALGADGVPPIVQPRVTAIASEGVPPMPPLPGRYSYVLFKLGPLQMTRRGVTLAGTAASLSFIVLQSASLCLTTTTPEQLAAGLRWFLSPLAILRVPVDEIILTLLLSLRFVGLVFDEVRNLALGVVARGIQWKSFKLMGTVEIFFSLVGRLFRNLFAHAEQISQAMLARGYKGNPKTHRLYFQGKFSPTFADFVAVLGLGLLFALVGASERALKF